jgi:putative transposase
MELQCREMAGAFVESFNGRLRDECLNSFLDLGDARRKIRVWVKDDNEQRPLRSLG